MRFNSPSSSRRTAALLLFYLGLGLVLAAFPGNAPKLTVPSREMRPDHPRTAQAPAGQRVGRAVARPTQFLSAATESRDRVRVLETYAALPLSFEANAGQVDRGVKFLARGRGYALLLASDSAVLALQENKANGKGQVASVAQRSLVNTAALPPVVDPALPVRAGGASLARATGNAAPQGRTTGSSILAMRLVGSSPSARIVGLDELPGKVNYFIGNDLGQWHVNVPTYARVKYEQIYPGVDLVYYGNQRQLEYDFVVAPGADPNVIVLEVGATLVAAERGFQRGVPLRIAENGDLVVKIGGGEVRFRNPIVYQVQSPVDRSLSTDRANQSARLPRTPSPESRIRLEGRYVFRGANRIGFEVRSYDRTLPLVVDPVLVYSTYLGGSGDDFVGNGNNSAGYPGGPVAVDSSGDAYIAGSTMSPNFPSTPGAFQPACKPSITGGCSLDAFVTKIKADGSALVYSTYLGGSGTDSGFAIAVDGSGNAYVAGQTNSTDFPTKNAFQPSCGGAALGCPFSVFDAFVTKLDATGSNLVYSTYLGGSSQDFALGIAVDSSDDAYVTGYTASSDFPTLNPYQPTLQGTSDAFVAKFNSTGTALVYSTYLGGAGDDQGNAIAVDSSGNAYLTGGTFSNNFPTTASALQTSYGGNTDAFVTKLSFAASKLALVYSTYLGGSNSDQGLAIALDSQTPPDAYVAGLTNSANFPVAGADGTFQGTSGGGNDGFVAKLDSAGKTLVYSTYLGGSSDDSASGIAVDSSGRAYVTGSTASTDFPLANPVQSKYAGNQDAFISRLAASGCGLTFSTYLGGHATDAGVGIALDSSANAYVVGRTLSNDFPTASPLQPKTGGSYDAFVTRASPADAAATCLSPAKLTFSSQLVGTTSAAQTVTLTNGGDVKLNISGFTVAPSQEFAQTNTCTGSVDAGKNCMLSITFTPTSGGTINGTITVNDDDSSSGNLHVIALTGTAADFGISDSPAKATVTAGQSTSPVTATLTPVGGFNAMVSLSCSNLPTGATCSFSPSSATVNGSSVTSTLVISTTARSSMVAPRSTPPGNRPPFRWAPWVAALFLLALLVVRWTRYRQVRLGWMLALPLGAVLFFTLVWSSCVSGSPGGGGSSGTPAGTYNIGVTGTSGSLTHAASFSLTVQ